MKILGRILFTVISLAVWVGALFTCGVGSGGIPSEGRMTFITLVCIAVIWWVGRKLFKKSPGSNELVNVASAQIIGGDSLENSIVDEINLE